MGSPSASIVLFDLFGTLVPGGSPAERDAVSREIAGDLGVNRDAFAELMRASFDERMRGVHGNVRETLLHLARQLDRDVAPEALDSATQRRLALTRSLHSRTWAVPALRALTSDGVRLGVVSDCSAETPEIWADSPLAPFMEVTSFSCVTGVRKPAPEAYMTAVRALGVEPSDCVFVGDGGSNELTGAAALGMTVYWFAPSGNYDDAVIDPDLGWRGPQIGDLAELVGLLATT